MRETTPTALRDAIARRVASCKAQGNLVQAKKWEREGHAFADPAYAAALDLAGFRAEALEEMAIYVAQKVRRLATAYLGAGRPDPYTVTLLRNARALAAEARRLDGRAARASLSERVRTAETLAVRRQASEGTAATQASSTRQALLALGAVTLSKAGMEVDWSHPFVAAIMGEGETA